VTSTVLPAAGGQFASPRRYYLFVQPRIVIEFSHSFGNYLYLCTVDDARPTVELINYYMLPSLVHTEGSATAREG
jgi:hypothetical protein